MHAPPQALALCYLWTDAAGRVGVTDQPQLLHARAGIRLEPMRCGARDGVIPGAPEASAILPDEAGPATGRAASGKKKELTRREEVLRAARASRRRYLAILTRRLQSGEPISPRQLRSANRLRDEVARDADTTTR